MWVSVPLVSKKTAWAVAPPTPPRDHKRKVEAVAVILWQLGGFDSSTHLGLGRALGRGDAGGVRWPVQLRSVLSPEQVPASFCAVW